MRVDLQLFATLASVLPADRQHLGVVPVDAPDGATVQDLLVLVGLPAGSPCIALVNGHDAPLDRALRDGDVVSLFPPLAGGR